VILDRNRDELDKSLANERATLFLLAGPRGSEAFNVHEAIEARKESWDDYQCWFLLTDLSVLKPGEDVWFKGKTPPCYAVLGNGAGPKAVADRGSTSRLLNQDGTPGYMKIRRAFLKGDL
jgi:hypothetical protein